MFVRGDGEAVYSQVILPLTDVHRTNVNNIFFPFNNNMIRNRLTADIQLLPSSHHSPSSPSLPPSSPIPLSFPSLPPSSLSLSPPPPFPDLVGDVVDHNGHLGSSVVHWSEAVVALLTGSVPYLKLYSCVVEVNCLCQEGG